MEVIKNPNELNEIIDDLKKINLDEALKKLKKVTIEDSNINLVLKLFASIYFQKKEWKSSIKYYEQMLNFKNEKSRIHNNIGVALFNLGKINESIVAYKKAIKENSNFDFAHNNIGISYNELGIYEEAAKHFVHALNINNNNSSAKSNLINIFLVFKPENTNRHPLIKINNEIKNITNKVNINVPIKSQLIKKLLNESDNIIQDTLKEINFNETQIYRKNSENLNCKRHFKVFNEFDVIPKYCFSCYKVQINVMNVVDLIRLFLIFDRLFLERNNIRKCITEIRHNIPSNYKGYIYCNGIEEAKEIFEKVSGILSQIKLDSAKILIKHGCTEFYESYPKYEQTNLNSGQLMTYDNNWEEQEKIIDNRIPVRSELDIKQIKKSLEGINLSDILIIRNWICYASIIKDFSYKEIYDKEIKSSFISNILKPQLVFRKKNFLKKNN